MSNKIDFEKIKKAAIASLKNPGKKKKPLPKSKNPNLFVFRHTQSKDNIERIFSGRRDTDLTEQGKKQAEELAKKLKGKNIDLFITAPLKRCKNTLKPILKFYPNAKVREEPLLLERDYGSLTGTSKEELMEKDFEKAILYRRSYDVSPPGGESIKQVKQERIDPFCRQLVEEIKQKNIVVAISCTNNTMRIIRMFFENLSILQMLMLENPFGDYAAYKVG